MPYDLTQREIQVVRLAVAGYTDMQLANEMFVSVLTVGAHLKNIAAKVGVETREEVVERARNEGWA